MRADAERGTLTARVLRIAFGVFAVALPARFLFSLGTTFHVDWTNHEWLVGYFGQYFRVHHWMPSALQTPELGGVPVPVFYGHLFYPLLAIPSAFVAPGVVVRVAGIAVLALQYVLVSRAFRALGVSWFSSSAIACLVIWAIYPLTNLFNRGALTEFVATGLLVCAAAMTVLLVTSSDAGLRRWRASALVFFLTLSAGTHPITALYGLPLFVFLVPALWFLLREHPDRRRSVVVNIAIWIPVAIVCLLPWFIVSATLSRHLIVGAESQTVVFFPASIDDWATRFFPIPHDSRVIDGQPLTQVSTPYLDAQISWSLLLVFAGIGSLAVVRRARRAVVIIGIATAFTAFFVLLSLVPRAYELLPARAGSIQFAYRAVTYVNLTLLLGSMLALLSSPSLVVRHSVAQTAVVAGCLVLAGIGLVVKWGHIAAVESREGSSHVLLTRTEREGLVHMPRWFYGAPDYATPGLFRDVDAEPSTTTNLSVNAKDRFGKVVSSYVQLENGQWVGTNVLAFPWNEIRVDDARVPADQLRRVEERTAVFIPEGKHKLMATFRAPAWWSIARAIAIAVSWAWLLYLTITYALRRWRTATDRTH